MTTQSHPEDLKALISLCEGSEGKPFLIEAVNCYSAGSFRACILTTWIAVVFDFIGKLRLLSMTGDANADQLFKSLERKLQSNDLKGLLDFEKELLGKAKDDFDFISHIEHDELDRLFSDRNKCAHPSMINLEEPYMPIAEAASYHLTNAVHFMLERPPTYGPATIEKLIGQIESHFFPSDYQEAQKYLMTTPINKPRESLLSNFVKVLLKKLSSHKLENISLVAQYAAALRAILLMHGERVKVILKSHTSNIFTNNPNSDLASIVFSMAMLNELWDYLQDDTVVILNSYVQTMPEAGRKLLIPLVFTLPEFDESTAILVHSLTEDDLTSLAQYLGPIVELKDFPVVAIQKSLELYYESDNFADANRRATSLIIPLVHRLTLEQVGELLDSAQSNSQIKRSHEWKNVLEEIKKVSPEHKRIVEVWEIF